MKKGAAMKCVKGFAIAAAGIGACSLGASSYLIHKTLRPYSAKQEKRNQERAEKEAACPKKRSKPMMEAELAAKANQEAMKDWWKSDFMETHETEECYIVSRDSRHYKLHAYKVENNQNPDHLWVIAVHGYRGKSEEMQPFAEHFFEKGFSVLLPDLRGHGKSEGNYIGMGWHERLDLVQWAETIAQEDPKAKIVLFGISMGAATVLMASGEKLPKQVKAVIEDSGYSSVLSEMEAVMKQMSKLSCEPLLKLSIYQVKHRMGYDIQHECSVVDQVKKSVTPTLFLHGEADTFVPTRMVYENYQAAACDKEIQTIPGATHVAGAATNPKRYWSAVWSFLESRGVLS